MRLSSTALSCLLFSICPSHTHSSFSKIQSLLIRRERTGRGQAAGGRMTPAHACAQQSPCRENVVIRYSILVSLEREGTWLYSYWLRTA
jgi:hypothetical protein